MTGSWLDAFEIAVSRVESFRAFLDVQPFGNFLNRLLRKYGGYSISVGNVLRETRLRLFGPESLSSMLDSPYPTSCQ